METTHRGCDELLTKLGTKEFNPLQLTATRLVTPPGSVVGPRRCALGRQLVNGCPHSEVIFVKDCGGAPEAALIRF
jgi:hypothetical protein